MLNNTALITGASKRIGKEMAFFLAKKNYNLVLHYNNSKQEALNLQAEITNNYAVKCNLVQFDLLNLQQVEEAKQIYDNEKAKKKGKKGPEEEFDPSKITYKLPDELILKVLMHKLS